MGLTDKINHFKATIAQSVVCKDVVSMDVNSNPCNKIKLIYEGNYQDQNYNIQTKREYITIIHTTAYLWIVLNGSPKLDLLLLAEADANIASSMSNNLKYQELLKNIITKFPQSICSNCNFTLQLFRRNLLIVYNIQKL